MTSLHPRLTSSFAVAPVGGHRASCERKSADGASPPRDAEKLRQDILVRLMRLDCARKGGCTRRCRRAGHCVAADAVVAKAAATASGDARRRP